MSDLISRQEAIDEANAWLLECLGVHKQNRSCGLIRRLEDLPAAQSESKTGKWIEAYDPFNRISGRCSVCGWEAHLYEDDVVGMNYCPNCGSYNGGSND